MSCAYCKTCLDGCQLSFHTVDLAEQVRLHFSIISSLVPHLPHRCLNLLARCCSVMSSCGNRSCGNRSCGTACVCTATCGCELIRANVLSSSVKAFVWGSNAYHMPQINSALAALAMLNAPKQTKASHDSQKKMSATYLMPKQVQRPVNSPALQP